MKTVVLFSGGLDSAVVLAGVVASGDECLALGFDYAQPHKIELDRTAILARHYGVSFEVAALPAMPKVNDVVFAGRNFVFASIGIATVRARGYDRIAVGCNASDWARFPDCRPEFWRNLERCADAYGVTIIEPLIYMSKYEVAQYARRLGVPIDITWSCYFPQRGAPCDKCLACLTRKEALECSSC